MASTPKQGRNRRGMSGFRQTGALVAKNIRAAGESRGFAVSRVLTQWDEIVGPELAAITRPVDVRYGRQGIGATLTVLTTGAQAPLVEMQKDRLRERVNACYGYAAISRVRVTQTAATGFAEGQVAFTPAPAPEPEPLPKAVLDKAQTMAADVADDGLREALGELAAQVLDKPLRQKRKDKA